MALATSQVSSTKREPAATKASLIRAQNNNVQSRSGKKIAAKSRDGHTVRSWIMMVILGIDYESIQQPTIKMLILDINGSKS